MASPGGPPQYVSRRTVAESYRPKGLMSPGLQRARAPYRVQNALMGIALGAFGVGVWAYSISAVKQDVFDDVDEEARELREAGVVLKSLEDEEKDRRRAAAGSHSEEFIGTVMESNGKPTPSLPTPPTRARGILANALSPNLLDPEHKTFIWGAPPVDNIGSLRDSVNRK
ncbi:hypothetical protein HWV62_24486 [Athelia sp. TMB]|nr:hypothetical protein HWV62_24486 [Athelia sp. TMB]